MTKFRSLFDSVENTSYPLEYATSIQRIVAAEGFDWTCVTPILEKIDEELHELREAVRCADRDAIAEELGDLFFACINFSRYYNLDSRDVIANTVEKFKRRFGYIERYYNNQGISLRDVTLEAMERVWEKAKAEEH